MKKRAAVKSVGKPVGKIEDETPIMPWIVADGVIEMACYRMPDALGEEVFARRDEIGEWLSVRMNEIYAANDNFRKKIRSKSGSVGRDHLYVVMEHWFASWLKQNGYERALKALPIGYGWNVSLWLEHLRERDREMKAAQDRVDKRRNAT